VCATIIPSCDTSPILSPADHILHFMACFIEFFSVPGRSFAVFSWRNAGLNALGLEGLTELITVIAFVADQVRGTGQQRVIHELCTDVIPHLTFAQK